jgi:DNA-binding XRE family transcriptional regulator
MKRNYLIPTPDWTSKTSVLTAACRVCGLSVGELQKRLRGSESLCAVAAGLLGLSAEALEQWQPSDDSTQFWPSGTTTTLSALFVESNPLRAARRSSGLSVTAFARMLGMSRQRLHVLERATGGEALLRACARAQAHGA